MSAESRRGKGRGKGKGKFRSQFVNRPYCTECHSGGDRDYTTLDHVQRDADTIRCGVSPEMLDGCGSSPAPAQFPVGTGPEPSDEERRRLVAWIDAGLPE